MSSIINPRRKRSVNQLPEDYDGATAPLINSIESGDSVDYVHTKPEGTSFAETLINFLKGNIGAGFLSMPFAFAQAGYLGSTILLSIIFAIVVHAMFLLVRTKQAVSRSSGVKEISYGQLAHQALGRFGTYSANVAILITQFGFCCVYIIFIAKHLAEFSALFSYRVYALFIIPGTVLLSLIKNFKAIAPTSLFANFCLLYSALVIFVYVIGRFGKETSALASCNIADNTGHGPACMLSPRAVMFAAAGTMPIFFGNAIYAFEAIGLVLPMENQIRKPSQFPKVVIIGMFVVFFLYLAFGHCGYVVFGDAAQGSVTLNLPNTALFASVKIALMLALFQSYAIQFFPAIEIIETVSQPWINSKVAGTKKRALYRNLLRVVLSVLIGALAIAIPNLGLIISLIGSLGAGYLALILPPLIHVRLDTSAPLLIKVKDWLLVVFGVFGSCAGTYVALKELIAAS